MFRDQHHDNGNRYDTHINMYPPAPAPMTEPLRSSSPVRVAARSQEVSAPYPIEDANDIINPVPMFTSLAPPATRIPTDSRTFGDSGNDSIENGERYGMPFQFPMNSSSSQSLANSQDSLRATSQSTDDIKDSHFNEDILHKRDSTERIAPPPPYEESQIKILQEKAYRTNDREASIPAFKGSKEEKVNAKTRDLSQYSDSALAFRKVYIETVADSSTFTPQIQIKWCETLLEYAFNDEFLTYYNINADKLKRELKSEEKLKNQKVILEHSFKVLTKLISMKCGAAMYLMGTLYSHQPYLKIKNRNIVVKNDKKALEYYCRASRLDHSDACYRAGVCYEFQKGVSAEEMTKPQSLQKALYYYDRGAQICNNSSCMYKLGMLSLYGEDETNLNPLKAVEWFKKAGKSGNSPQSIYELGKIYEFTGLPKHTQKLLQQSNIKMSSSKSLKYYYDCAMNFSYPIAQWKLGHCYEFGELQLPVFAKKSIAWYAKASLAEPKGNAMAMLSLSGWYLTGASGVLQPNDEEAFKWAQKSCQASDGKFGRAEYALGYYYENGIGCQKDLSEAMKHYNHAAKLGHLKAIERLRTR
ncbi:hypothetical protein HG535_0F04990 [Zygotorulaspora mrakii]|uniref:Activator of C kinase protein 1 n=1 Tax=Zygotorulaspora mrakii TaxID=42260 RepID=A0A7H9B5Z9_ZYGMR|nr:uncharacterized protein HG535_0F04990 [Zygotorulaspora mrakii]QLG73987.1 hypothetical protein HG535_0F04990 [Zygotorulaspora mrakii]